MVSYLEDAEDAERERPLLRNRLSRSICCRARKRRETRRRRRRPEPAAPKPPGFDPSALSPPRDPRPEVSCSHHLTHKDGSLIEKGVLGIKGTDDPDRLRSRKEIKVATCLVLLAAGRGARSLQIHADMRLASALPATKIPTASCHLYFFTAPKLSCSGSTCTVLISQPPTALAEMRVSSPASGKRQGLCSGTASPASLGAPRTCAQLDPTRLVDFLLGRAFTCGRLAAP